MAGNSAFQTESGGRQRTKPRVAKARPVARPRAEASIFTKIGVIALASFIVSGMVTWVVALAIAELPELRGIIGRSNYSDILFLVFLVGFILSLSASAYAFISKDELSGNIQTKKFERSEKVLWKQALQPPKLSPQQEQALKLAQMKRFAEESHLLNDLDDDDTESTLSKALAELDNFDGALDHIQLPKLNINAEKQKVTLMTFLSRGLESVMQSRPKLDTFSKFGVNLYLAGACEALGLAEALTDEELNTILVECVGVLGTSQGQALKFSDSYEDYLRNAKYLTMIETGREAMQGQLRGNANSALMLENALEEWTTRKSGEPTSAGTVAVMFTDIVGSTAITQAHGDAAAQEVVRTHNRIVRAALTTYQGREVKHTGDGIMASFYNSAHAVEAAIYIQNKVTQDNANNPAVPLGVKIGINTGEPIVEDDDLFGSTVQLAARIVDKAENYQIFISETVKGICQGKSFQIESRGMRELKGFKEPMAVYEVNWRGFSGDTAPARVSTAAAAE
ncbi:MAG: adenylate/guanylate cyclase domain-containing protein [Rhodospirillales bacterium]|nr:adenylate/guanylate cyclase domain-containing protein [Rhodospirillales bacterium]